ncbi:hypothetical protein AB6D67_14040 [Vibrio splendidus]
MPLWRLEPYAVKVARTVLRETALGNKCRPPDISEVECTTGKNSACEGFGQLSFEENALIAVITKRLCRF